MSHFSIYKFIFTLIILSNAKLAAGHVIFDSSSTLQPRSNRDNISTAPCGATAIDENLRTTFMAGSDIEIQFLETIDFNAKYKLSFSFEDDTFSIPLMDLNQFDVNALNQASPEWQDQEGDTNNRINPHVYTVTVSLPNLPCESCSIQVIQKAIEGDQEIARFHSCSDIRLTVDPNNPPPPPKPQGLKVLIIEENEVSE